MINIIKLGHYRDENFSQYSMKPVSKKATAFSNIYHKGKYLRVNFVR